LEQDIQSNQITQEMAAESIQVHYKVYNHLSELPTTDANLILEVREICKSAYAPYSRFRVGALALMEDNSKIHGTNQENASYPIGLCAERVLLAAVSSIAPDQKIKTLAISYESDEVDAMAPVAPCGMCRQSLVEYESRFNEPIRLLLSGQTGTIIELNSVSDLLPFAFKHFHLGK
jgi:cytidine deaminase